MVHTSVQLYHCRKFLRQLVLKWHVRPSKRERDAPKCLKQMADVMTCWKATGFNDQKCRRELALFRSCSDEAIRNRAEEKAKTGHTARGGEHYWHHEEVNTKLLKFSKPQ